MQPALVIFSGLPGVGKSTLASQLARTLHWPLLNIDDVVGKVPENPGIEFWDSKVEILLNLVDTQLSLGLDVIADSVFMNMDRQHAQELARKHKVRLLPIYVYISNEKVWQERVEKRLDEIKDKNVASWESIQHQRERFAEWLPNTALFVDSLESVDGNFERVLNFVTSADISLLSLPAVRLSPGRYHK